MALDDAVRNRQAQPRALPDRLRREERIEDPADDVGRHARARIADRDRHLLAIARRADRDHAALGNRLRRVHQQVHEDLVQLRRQAFDLRHVAVIAHDVGLVLEFVVDDVERAFQARTEIDHAPLVAGRAREIAQVLHDAPHAQRAVDRFVDQRLDLAAHVVQVRRAARRRQRVARGRVELRQRGFMRGDHVEQTAHPRLQRVEVRTDEADRIVDLVRDTGRELADRRELFRLQQLHVGFLEHMQQAPLLLLLLFEPRLRGLAFVDLGRHVLARVLQHRRRLLVAVQRAFQLGSAQAYEPLERIGHPAQEGCARIEAAQQQRDDQGGRREQRDRRREPRHVDPVRGPAPRVRREMRGRHRRVVHAGDGDAHHEGRTDPLGGSMARLLHAQRLCDPERGSRRDHRDADRRGEQRGIVADAGFHAHRGHPRVMHAGDPGAHQCAAHEQPPPAQPCARDDGQREVRHEHGNRQRRARIRPCVAERNRQRKREHADEMHRPDAGAHGHRAAAQPRTLELRIVEQRNEGGQVECRIGGQRRDRERQQDEREIVGAVHDRAPGSR